MLASLYQAMARLELDPANTVVVSGIGCSSRLPFFVKTYGFQTAHGRVLPVAIGVKIANPDLTVIAVGGDGDGFSIGGGHLAHAVRRNPDITYVVMDNEVYGLTKGQTSPTSPVGLQDQDHALRLVRHADQPHGLGAGLGRQLCRAGLFGQSQAPDRPDRAGHPAPWLCLHPDHEPLPHLQQHL